MTFALVYLGASWAWSISIRLALYVARLRLKAAMALAGESVLAVVDGACWRSLCLSALGGVGIGIGLTVGVSAMRCAFAMACKCWSLAMLCGHVASTPCVLKSGYALMSLRRGMRTRAKYMLGESWMGYSCVDGALAQLSERVSLAAEARC